MSELVLLPLERGMMHVAMNRISASNDARDHYTVASSLVMCHLALSTRFHPSSQSRISQLSVPELSCPCCITYSLHHLNLISHLQYHHFQAPNFNPCQLVKLPSLDPGPLEITAPHRRFTLPWSSIPWSFKIYTFHASHSLLSRTIHQNPAMPSSNHEAWTLYGLFNLSH